MSANMVAVLYLISALMFIFALRGLSHPESSRLGNIFGIVGMVIAIITTLMFKSVLSYVEIGAAILVGGAIGTPRGRAGIHPPCPGHFRPRRRPSAHGPHSRVSLSRSAVARRDLPPCV